MMPTDSELLEQYCRTNDATAFDELARRYRSMVFASAQRITGDRHDAEDVTQTCFLELARRATAVTTSVPAYLHSAATFRARNVIRDRMRRRKHEHQAASERSIRSDQHDPNEKPWEVLAPEVDAAIEDLPENERVPIILYYLRGLTDQEISLEMGLSVGAVKRRLQVGVRRLRSMLAKGGAPLSIAALTIGLRSNTAQAVPSSLKATLGRIALVGMGSPPKPVPGVARKMPRAWHLSRTSIYWSVAAVVIVALSTGAWIVRSSLLPAEHPYDRLQATYRPFMSETFSWRTAAMTQNEVMFWRGSQPMFYDWCKAHAADWLGESDAYVLCHASPYLLDAHTLPNEIDVANSARLPFQIELLQALVALRLENGTAEDPERFDGDRELFDAYRNSLLSLPVQPQPSSVELESEELNRFVGTGGVLRPVVLSRAKNVAEIVRPLDQLGPVVEALTQAIGNSPRFASLFAKRDSSWLRQQVVSAGYRTHVNGAASQGLLSLLVLIQSPSADVNGDLLIEFHEVTPAAAELAGAIANDGRPAGRRAAEDMDALAPASAPTSWCEFEGKSMLVRLHREPVNRQGRAAVAYDWAVATAATHRTAPNRADILAALTPDLLKQLSTRADQYAARLEADFEDFRHDPRSEADSKTIESEQASLLSAAYRKAAATNGISK